MVDDNIPGSLRGWLVEDLAARDSKDLVTGGLQVVDLAGSSGIDAHGRRGRVLLVNLVERRPDGQETDIHGHFVLGRGRRFRWEH